MEFLRKSLFLKFATISLVVLLVLGAAGFVLLQFWKFDIYPLLAGFAVLWLVSLMLFVLLISRPFRKMLREMKAMLTGKSYRRIFTKKIDALGVVAHFFNEVTTNLEKVSAALAEGKRMSAELSLANNIQQNILPKQMPEIPGIEIFGKTRAAVEVGGDSFDIFTQRDNTYIYVGDVTGHGAPSALIMMIVNTLIRTLSETYASGYDLLVHTNRLLKPKIEANRFMTVLLLRWNSTEKKMFFTGAGHEHLLMYRKKEKMCEVRKTGGIALGMIPDNSQILKEQEVSLESGDGIVLYSDGIPEARNTLGEMYGLNRLKGVIERFGETDEFPDELFTHISKDFISFAESQTQEDDMTLIVVKKK